MRAKVTRNRWMAVLALSLALGACDTWLTDFRQQPSVGTWLSPSARVALSARAAPSELMGSMATAPDAGVVTAYNARLILSRCRQRWVISSCVHALASGISS